VIVGLFRFKKSEEKDPTFFAIVLAFTCAFLLFTIISDERLFFSSHFLSFFVAYIFMVYPHRPDASVDET
jgi:predicted membrane protein